jgi:anti-sigma factor RsiW
VSGHVADRLSAYLDGALDVRDLEHVQAHLDTCPACVREHDELVALRGLLRGLPEPAVPEGFAQRLHWRLTREAARGARPGRRDLLAGVLFRPAPLRLALACAALLLLLGLPLGWVVQWGAHERPLDADAYVRDYLLLSTNRPLADEAAATLVTSTSTAPEPPTR